MPLYSPPFYKSPPDLSVALSAGGPDTKSYVLAGERVPAGQPSQISGGVYDYQVRGTLNGASVTLQVQDADGNWIGAYGLGLYSVYLLTSLYPYGGLVSIPYATRARVQVTGGTPSNLFITLTGTYLTEDWRDVALPALRRPAR